jgi:AAA ATPase domain
MARRRAPENPFRVGGLVTDEFFTDRADERRRIRRALTEAQAHLLVFGPRRMGKSSTLLVVEQELEQEDRPVLMADLSTASTVADMSNRILQAASKALGRRWNDLIPELLRRVQLSLSVKLDPQTGLPVPSVNASLREAGLDAQRASLAGVLDAIEDLATTRRTHVGIVLDEFQEIHRFGAESAEAHLRGILQRHRRVSYVLAGSDERLIQAMTGRARPFYRLLEPLHFGPIDPDHMARWIDSRTESAGVRPTRGLGALVVRLAGPRTRDIVQLARATFEAGCTTGAASDETVAAAFRQIALDEDAPIRALWEGLSPLQQNVARALAVQHTGLTTKAVRARFALGASGAATKAAQTLVERDLLVKQGSGYAFDSPFLRAWVLIHALPDVGLLLPVTHDPYAPCSIEP